MPQTVLITGASSGIGRATAHLFAERGDHLVLLARGRQALEDTATEARAKGAGDVVVCPADVLDEDALGTAVDGAVRRFGSLDVVVHSAQVIAYGRIEDVPKAVFERVVDTALHGTANLVRTVLPVFRRQGAGHLVVVSSLLASVTTPFMGSYNAAKWGQLGLVRTLQQETRDVPGIHVSAVAPGGVNTPIYSQAGSYIGLKGRPPVPIYSPERVARSVVARLDRPRRLIQSGFANPVVILGFRLLPAVYDALVGPLLRVFALADDDRTVPTPGNVLESNPAGNATAGRWHGIP
ncbi:NAD(P)-dependent dehydrogenase (short-subunit alcohol dehydrogenase family) [Geodermatophilus bullaregiensis]|uniref:SDR family NAD(P)-dependent oxidoreductase n=1 Tax=Geodermatophilus bullaregiensis TaxID=1564160 RepID=UPI00195C4FE2|nr:SDR family NAD(P)-dependent oxidoreductase [Geodermatophilus bullaregiensis]MBM7808376.1 NAD(P)-dependent dehydrogenase (short-subunit alcohol dehydrogenase family) [Geodermatophilus bullaregiensis]